MTNPCVALNNLPLAEGLAPDAIKSPPVKPLHLLPFSLYVHHAADLSIIARLAYSTRVRRKLTVDIQRRVLYLRYNRFLYLWLSRLSEGLLSTILDYPICCLFK